MKRNLSAIFPNGCTREQRDKLINEIVDTYGTVVNWKKWSNTAKRLYEEMNALNMLESCFAYGGINGFYVQHEAWEYCGKGSHYDHYLADYIEVGGNKEEFDKMISIQTEFLTEKCDIVYAGTDSDGLSYNGIVLK